MPSGRQQERALLALKREGYIATVSTGIGGTETTCHRKLKQPSCVSPAKIFPRPGNGRNPGRVL